MNLVSSKVKGIVLLGKTEQHVMNLKNAFENVVEMMKYTNNMLEAVKVARQMASEGDTILLSPGCASFDLFENYEARGKAFKDIVLNS